MKKKHTKILCLLLAALMLTGLFLPAYADGEDPISDSGTEATPGSNESTPAIQSIDINANYYAEDTEGSYTIIFTIMEEIPAFTHLSMKVSLENAKVNDASFESSFMEGNSAEIGRYPGYAIFPLSYAEAKTISAKTRLCTLTVTEAEASPSMENLTITEFSIVKENESESTPLTADITVEEGPIIPELNEETQAVFDTLCTLPNPATISFYQEDGSFTNLMAIKEKAVAAKTAYNALPSASRTALDTVMEYYNKPNYATSNLASVAQTMYDVRGLIEIAKATESITSDNALSFQFLISVFEAKKNVNLENISPDSTARSEINQVISTMQTAATTVANAKTTADAETDGGCKTKTYACQSQIAIIQSLGEHKYHKDYLSDLESQITVLKADTEVAYASDAIMKKALLDTLSDVESTVGLIKEGIKELPTVVIKGFNLRSSYTVTFTRKTLSDESLDVQVSFVVTDKNGTEVDTITKTFPSNARSLDVSVVANPGRYKGNELYTFHLYYHINDGKFLIDTQELECTNYRLEGIGGLGTNTGTGLGGGNSTVVVPTTPSTGGTIFPDSNDEPEVIEPESNFNDIGNYTWASEAIDTLYEAGIINGMEEGIFNPAGQVTREQFCKMVVALFDIPLGTTVTSFDDVSANAWYAPYITAAMQAGYVQGQSDEYFGIGESIMRQDMAVILYRALGDQNSKAILNFSDKENIAPYAEDAIAELVGLGIINGYEDGSFQPRGTATRAEAAKMIYGIYQYLNQ